MSQSGHGSGKSRSTLTAWPRAVVGESLGNKGIWQSRKSPAVWNACVQSSSGLAQTTQKVFVWHWVAVLLGIRYLQGHTENCLCSDIKDSRISTAVLGRSNPDWIAVWCFDLLFSQKSLCHVTCIHFVQQCVQCTSWRDKGAKAETWKGP